MTYCDPATARRLADARKAAAKAARAAEQERRIRTTIEATANISRAGRKGRS